MQIMNTGKGPRILRNGLEIPPGGIATIDDAEWAKVKESPVTQSWIKRGDLKEVPGEKATVEQKEVPSIAAGLKEAGAKANAKADSKKPDETDPLDHDGDGKKGGSKPKADSKK